jgi:hypothetical protein
VRPAPPRLKGRGSSVSSSGSCRHGRVARTRGDLPSSPSCGRERGMGGGPCCSRGTGNQTEIWRSPALAPGRRQLGFRRHRSILPRRSIHPSALPEFPGARLWLVPGLRDVAPVARPAQL